MISLVFISLVSQSLVYADEGFGIRLFISPAWTVTEKREDDHMVLVHLEKEWLKAMLIYGIVPDLLGQPDPPRFLLSMFLAEMEGGDIKIDPLTQITVAGLVGCQTTLRGKMDEGEYVGVTRIISLAREDKAVILAIGKENSVYFLSEDVRDMEEFISGLRLAFGPAGY